ncbi:MAG: efflux RND transporter permease subunit, partial [SAR86 cluster bacterium]
MKNIVLAAINKSRASVSVFILLSLWGVYALGSLPKATEPDVQFPGVGVSVVYEGVSPQDSERLLAKPLETALRTIEGVEEVSATATTGYVFLRILFDQDWDMDKGLYDVRVKVDEVRPLLPADTREPNVLEFSTSDEPILTVGLLSDSVSERVLRKLAESLQDEIETIPEVLEADLQGVPEEMLEALVRKSDLESYGISMSELFQAISNANRVIPAGSQDTGKGRFQVNVPSVFDSLEDINNLPIKVSGNSVVTLTDVAEIRRTFKDRSGYSRINGMPAVSIDIKKRSGTNVIDTNKKVKALVAEEQKRFPPGIDVIYSRDNADWALDMISETEGNVLTAVVIVMIVVLAALGFRTSVLVGMAIPFSYLFALMIMSILGKEFNFMVMFGMLISMGMT